MLRTEAQFGIDLEIGDGIEAEAFGVVRQHVRKFIDGQPRRITGQALVLFTAFALVLFTASLAFAGQRGRGLMVITTTLHESAAHHESHQQHTANTQSFFHNWELIRISQWISTTTNVIKKYSNYTFYGK